MDEGDDDNDVAGNDSVNSVGSTFCFLSSLHHPHVLSNPKVDFFLHHHPPSSSASIFIISMCCLILRYDRDCPPPSS